MAIVVGACQIMVNFQGHGKRGHGEQHAGEQQGNEPTRPDL